MGRQPKLGVEMRSKGKPVEMGASAVAATQAVCAVWLCGVLLLNMGACMGKGDSEGEASNKKIEAQLRKERKQLDHEVKLLLLGAFMLSSCWLHVSWALTVVSRCWGVRQVHDYQADEDHSS